MTAELLLTLALVDGSHRAVPRFAYADQSSNADQAAYADHASRPRQAKTFETQVALQALYDEVSEATLGFPPSDLDLFHAVICTANWQYQDEHGQTVAWAALRDEWQRRMQEAPPESLTETIESVAVEPESVVAVVSQVAMRRVVDRDGSHAPPAASHLVAETMRFRDHWVWNDSGWRQQSREALGPKTVVVDPQGQS